MHSKDSSIVRSLNTRQHSQVNSDASHAALARPASRRAGRQPGAGRASGIRLGSHPKAVGHQRRLERGRQLLRAEHLGRRSAGVLHERRLAPELVEAHGREAALARLLEAEEVARSAAKGVWNETTAETLVHAEDKVNE